LFTAMTGIFTPAYSVSKGTGSDGQGPVQPGTGSVGNLGPSTLTPTLQVVDPPHQIAWTGTTMGIKAVHLFRFQVSGGGTLAHSEESWEGLIARLLKGYSRKTLDKGIRSVLSHLKTEAEREAAAAERDARGHAGCPVRLRAGDAGRAGVLGFRVGDGVGAWMLGIGAPLLATVVWGALVVAKARGPVPDLDLGGDRARPVRRRRRRPWGCQSARKAEDAKGHRLRRVERQNPVGLAQVDELGA